MKKFTICLTLLFAMASVAMAQDFTERRNGPASPSRGVANALYSQDDAAIGNTGSGIVATELGGLGAGVNEAVTADEFVVPAGTQWNIDGVVTTGFSNNIVLPESFTVRFYTDGGGVPGAVVYEWNGTPANGLVFEDQDIDLSADPAVLGPGTYWVSVHAVHNTAADLGTFRWNWNTGPNAFGLDWHLFDEGLFGGLDWTSATDLAITDVSASFVLAGSSQALVPTLGEWGLIAFITLMAGSALVMARKRRLVA